MNILIFDYSVVPNTSYQQSIKQLFRSLGDATVRFVNGILDAAWHIRHFRPDVILFDWIGDCSPIRSLVTAVNRIDPGVPMFHLDGRRFAATACLCGLPAEPAVPQWLHGIASDWIHVRYAPVPTMSS